MAFLLRTPSPPLSAYIRALYTPLASWPYRNERVFPMPTVDIKINFGGPLGVREERRALASYRHSWCVGVSSRHHSVVWPTDTQFVGISFREGGASMFLGVPIGELHNRTVPLDAIWGSGVEEMRERLALAATPQLRLSLVEEFLLHRMLERPACWHLVGHALRRIAQTNGSVGIRSICDELEISHKHLIELFKDVVGGTPKEIARLVRFRHILERIDPDRPSDWTSVAHENGYFDQSHFSRDFETYTGLNPTTYLYFRRRVHAARPDHAAQVRVLNVESLA